MAEFAAYIDGRNKADADAGLVPRLASPHDAFVIVGAVVELASRQIRTGEPAEMRELEPIVDRIIVGMLAAAEGATASA